MQQSLRFSKYSLLAFSMFLSIAASAAPKVHVISFGRWIQVQWFAGSNSRATTTKIRALMVDGRAREYVIGSPHEITERLFVVRRAFRVNDSLPDESGPRWQWERGGWVLVDRVSGRVSPTNLPAFDPHLSTASWYRDYVAYCGVGDDGKKTYAVVAQLNRRKAVLKSALSSMVKDDAETDSICPAPLWQKSPVRVSFAPSGGEKQTFAIRGTAVDLISDEDEE